MAHDHSPHEIRHRGWYHRGYLPHFDAAETHQSITYRLIDSIPKDVLVRFQRLVMAEPHELRQGKLRRMLETYADAGYGSCLLRNPIAARIVIDSWHYLDGDAYDLHAWVVMPNHVHVLIKQNQSHTLKHIVMRWKSYTATHINKALGRSGSLWMPDYWDRFIRDEKHYLSVVHYIEQNPVSAGIVRQSELWPWSSAYRPSLDDNQTP